MNDESETFSYGPDGSWFFVEKDSDADGTIDSTVKYFYDANQNIVREQRNQNPSDTKQIDYLFTAVYDSEGRQVDARYDNQGDSILNQQLVHTYIDDKLISRIVYFDESPVPARQTLFEYDDNDLPIKISVDSDDDPEMEFIRYQSFDTSGNLIRRETDDGANGVITEIETHTYDNFGNQPRTKLANEVDVSAQIDFISTREYVTLGWGVLQESIF